ncbi:hypothetical protein FRB96_000410 [Tulasnella sp. 330]|nr:hypothetical protein FRB96_000410 [Tulasnella sp. 330]KAG8890964.1 hypothetical protein FRB98_002984 [Tulasnella sp. 332]
MSAPSSLLELEKRSNTLGSKSHTDPYRNQNKPTNSTGSPTIHDHDHKDPHTNLEDAEAGAVVDDDHKDKTEDGWEIDPANPRNWTAGKKWRMTGVVAAYTFVSPLASSMMAPALPQVADHFNITNASVVALTLTGLGGSAPLTIGAGAIADMFREENRAGAMAIYTMGPLIGPVVGPVAGGFIVQNLSYRWIFWIISMSGGAASIFGLIILEETYHPVIIEHREMKNFLDDEKRGTLSMRPHRPALKDILWMNLTRPVMLLTRSFICFVMSLYMSIIYGILYLMFVTFPSIYEGVYGWSPGISGLAYLGPGIGFMIGLVLGGAMVDKIYLRLRDRNGGVGKPEFRIPIMFVGTVCLPIGLLWYGWTADKHLHWILPIIGSGIYGLGMMTCYLPIQVYLVDSFKYAASAIAAATVLRSSFGFAFPLFADRIFISLGVGGGYSLLTGILLAVGVPFPVWIYFKGESLRARDKLAR